VKVVIKKEKLISMYTVMLRIRIFEERVAREFADGNIPGFCHVYIGEEAVATGACTNLKTTDYITSTHRGHGHVIAKGAKTDRMMAELFGKKTGYNSGKGGSMHVADTDIGILGANGIVGAGSVIAGGVGLSAMVRGTDQVVVCFLGDGATNNGRFHEGVNLAACWQLPVIYIIENNLYAQATRITNTCKVENLSDRAVAYGIPGVTVDGNDVLAVYEVVNEAVNKAREGEGPTIIECKTYRWHGHYEGDPQVYKSKEEVEEWLKKDPVLRFQKQLAEIGVLTETEADRIKRQMADEMNRAVKFAQESSFPDPEDALEGVYA
jgi:TPP-dependent pyruvate/acetoin dehydrogenase alpha subunit